MKIKKAILIILITILFFNTTSFAVENNIEKNTELNLYCDSCILVECSSNTIAYEKNIDKKMFPASTTKVLTAIITLEKCNLTDMVTITNDMVANIPNGYTIAYLQPGEQYTIEQLLNLLLIPSANDAGFALAIHISGSVDSFAKLMNETAKKYGCTNSNFTNPSGIHNENHYSTARDMAILGLVANSYPIINEIGKKTSYQINGHDFKATNTLIQNNETNFYEFATGLKTGFTDQAGSCIIATAQKNDMKYLAVILKCPKSVPGTNYRDIDSKTLFEYGFNNHDNIIPSTEVFHKKINKILFGEKMLEHFFRILGVLITLLAFYFFMKNRKNKNEILKNKNNDNKFNEFNFKCLNW